MININLLDLRVIKEDVFKYDTTIKDKISSPSNIHNIAIQALQLHERDVEILVLYTLDTSNHVTGIFEVSKGTLNSSLVHPREVFKRAMLQNANSIILAHNHPSGSTKPSKPDIDVTRRIKKAGDLLGIPLLDHVIVGDESNYISMKQEGLL